ncbi:MAG: aspartate kinase, aspartate kinase [Candidatus Dadabacteria bacterium CSP1-2]|nr:MAG: aspartate kinase, aspartate kinase [Candidatus Dadabacteria bacterium CSP1-2]
MALIVQKYGGTSLANLDKIRQVAEHIIRTKKKGDDVLVVSSAMAGETDRLIRLSRSIIDPPDERELDVVTSSGEQVSSGLLAMMIKSLGYDAVSFQGHQVRIITDNAYSKARIVKIDDEKIKKALLNGKIVVVAGFQGVDEEGNVTTLGRGGSDLTAVSLAAVLKADACELYKDDVDGVYTTDPGICRNARKLKKISYDEMLEMASLGSKVLQARAVEFAKKFSVPIHVRPTGRPDTEGTWVVEEEEAMAEMEDIVISGVTYDKNQAKITIMQVPDRPGIAAKLFTPIGNEGIVVDMIVQNVSTEGYTDMTFTVPRTDFKKALRITEEVAKELSAKGVTSNNHIAMVSLVGVGMKTHSGIASRMFSALAREGINIIMISTSEIKVSCVIDEKYTELAVRTLHDAFNLGE